MSETEIKWDDVVVLEEPVPCGTSITTTYYLNGGKVRQDVKIIVDAGKCGFALGGAVNLKGA